MTTNDKTREVPQFTDFYTAPPEPLRVGALSDWKIEREGEAITVWHDVIGGYAATEQDTNIASTVLYHLAATVLATPTPAPVAQGEAAAGVRVVGWCALTKAGSIAYFDGKPMFMTGPVGNECHPTPLYAGAAPERAEVRPPVLTESYPLADALYRAGYEDRSRGRDYDPRGCLEWQSVVDAITPPSAADSAQALERNP